jgi:hypothetical protein
MLLREGTGGFVLVSERDRNAQAQIGALVVARFSHYS